MPDKALISVITKVTGRVLNHKDPITELRIAPWSSTTYSLYANSSDMPGVAGFVDLDPEALDRFCANWLKERGLIEEI